MSLGRGEAWDHFGAPTDQLGSVNDPRTQVEHGVKWNEKWIYRRDDQSVEKTVLFLRYDLVGAFQVAPDGSVAPLALPDEDAA